MRIKKLMSGILSALMMTSAMSFGTLAAEDGDIPVDATHFPDPVFREWVEHIDKDNDGYISIQDCEQIYNIEIPDMGIKSLVGIEYFENVQHLDCSGNELTSLDLSHNPDMYILECNDNQLTSMDLTGCTMILNMFCFNNQLTVLNLSDSTRISGLYLSNNPLTQLELNSSEFASVDVSDTNLEVLDIRGHYRLMEDVHGELVNLNEYLSANPDYSGRFSMSPHSDSAYVYLSYEGYPVFGIPAGMGIITEDEGDILYPAGTPVPTPTPVVTPEPTEEPEITEIPTVVPEVPEEPTEEPTAAPEVPEEPTEEPTAAPEDISIAGVEGFAERLYTCALDRDFDEAGKDYWADALRHGTTGADAAYGFLFSDEVVNADLSDEVFVNRLYATLMDREPAAAETEYWTGAIADGTMTRSDVFAGFINSEEWANVCVTYGILSGGTGVPSITVEPSEAIIDFATRLYTTCLNREADEAGLEWWAGELANLRTTGSAAAQSYFFSEEFVNAGVDDREFVNRLYLTFMNRDAADGEFDYWLGEMGNGMSRETVFGGFAGSEEFGNICASYGIIR